MSQGTSNGPPSQQFGGSLCFDAMSHEYSIQAWAQDSIAVPSDLQGQSASPQEPLTEYLTGSDELSFNEMVLLEDYLSSQESADIESAGIANHFPFDGNALAQHDVKIPMNPAYERLIEGLGLLTLDIPPYYEPAGPLTCSTLIDSSPTSPVELCVGNFKQELPCIELSDTTDPILWAFDQDEHLQHDDVYIPPNGDAFLATSWDINGPSSPSRIGLPEPWLTIKIEDIEDLKVVKDVGSLQIQEAAGRRRKKGGYQCPFRNITGCSAIFTARHNLRYHINSHRGDKPYRCRKCPYSAASPATMKRHRSTCKGTVSKLFA